MDEGVATDIAEIVHMLQAIARSLARIADTLDGIEESLEDIAGNETLPKFGHDY